MAAMNNTFWDTLFAHLQARHAGLIRAWFNDLRLAEFDHGEVVIRCNDVGQLRYLREDCLRAFVDAAQLATGRLVGIRFVGPDGAVDPAALAGQTGSELRLNAEYRFDEFVTGPCNRLAHAASVAVSEKPGLAYNPLFLHGNAGLGKTHLLQAICHEVLDRVPAARVVYLSCETFTNHFIESVEKGALHDFRYRYRHADLLVIDDIQFLAMRERSQEEFFHTFNTLYQEQRQIVLSADCQPNEIPSLEDRLVSRFTWGLVARVDPPCLETRIAIIRKKARKRGIDLPDDVILLIASEIKTNARELEGALCKLRGVAELHGGRITIDLARQTLADVIATPRRMIGITDIIEAVTKRFNVKMSDLQGKRRSKSIALPRQICMHLSRRLTAHSLQEIGGYFGGRDHTTVLHADRSIAQRRDNDPQLRTALEQIEAEFA